jgi:hypothetical protein
MLCEDDTRVLGWGWGVVMHQVMVWAKAADCHCASGIVFRSAARCDFVDPQSVVEKYNSTKPLSNL